MAVLVIGAFLAVEIGANLDIVNGRGKHTGDKR